jgi:hypothetical protein
MFKKGARRLGNLGQHIRVIPLEIDTPPKSWCIVGTAQTKGGTDAQGGMDAHRSDFLNGEAS